MGAMGETAVGFCGAVLLYFVAHAGLRGHRCEAKSSRS